MSSTTSSEQTASSLRSLMPRTPPAARPMRRTSSELKRVPMPLRVIITTSSPGFTRRTSTSSSPSSMLMARMPLRLTFLKSPRSVFFTVPFFVANITSTSPSKLRIGRSWSTCSPGWRLRKLTSGLPKLVRAASGIS